jgi:aerobic-type carbon monoxide dehydrogenase small subunit (CoxS/CutS family)
MAKSPITDAGVRLRINGSEHMLQIEPRVTLLDALREFAHLSQRWPTVRAASRLATEGAVDHGENRFKINLAPRVVARALLTVGGIA